MKYLYLFLLVSSTVFSQNYHYAVDEAKEPAATPDTTAPSNPINLVASNITQTTTTLSWTASTDNVAVADYRVYNNGVLLLGSTGGPVTSFTLTTLSPSTNYTLTVRAVDAANNVSGNSNSQAFATGTLPVADTVAPTNPTSLAVTNITQTTATLNWTASTDAVGVVDYRVYNNGVLLLSSTGGPVTSFTLTGLNPATNYTLTVRAVDAANNESGVSNNQNVTTQEAQNYDTTRFIALGASIMYNAFFFESQIVSQINSSYPNENVEVHNEGSVGATIGWLRNNIDTILAKYTDISTTQTFCLIHIGGNDVTNTRPYTDLTQTEINNLTTSLNFILDAVEAKGFTPIILDLTFRDYDDTTYNNEENGSKPYNDNIIIPKILSRSSEFAFSDGQSFMQPYTLIYNDYDTYLNADNIHLSGTGYTAFKQHFVNTICKYIFTGVAPTKIEKKGQTPSGTFPNNMPGEDDFLNAYYYPSAGSSISGLQNAIDTHGAVRLDQGNYGQDKGPIYLNSNDKLYGYINTTLFPNIVIRQGSSNILINGINYSNITIESGTSVSNNIIKNARSTDINFTNASFENNTIVNINGFLNWDNSASGYFRNNKIIKFWPHGGNPQLIWKGNDATPSYGNLQMWTNHLTSAGNTSEYDNLDTITILGLDAEGWNLTGGGTRAMTYMRNIGDVKITDFGGGNGYSQVKTPAFDIETDHLLLLHSEIGNASTNNDIVRGNADIISIKNRNTYDYNTTGFNLNLHGNNTLNTIFNGINQISAILLPTDVSNIKNNLQAPKKTPIARPNLPAIPDPTGTNWTAQRVGKTDQTAYIQNLIDTKGVAELPEGIYYIGSTLNLRSNEGIKGSGTGKTAIVGLTDNFPLITFSETATNKKIHLRNLTLQGGHTGLLIKPDDYNVQLMITSMVMQDVVFRNQTYGIHLDRFFGFDNNFFENVNFVNCNIGLFQDPNPNASGTQPGIMYIDKTVFYRSQVINCGVGFSMIAGRPNNLNSWVDCEFDGNGVAVDMHYNNYPIFMNCDFTNHTGEYVVGRTSPSSFYSCNFSGNRTTTVLKMLKSYMEGCVINDNMGVFADGGNNNVEAYLLNCNITGTLGNVDNGILSNSIIQSTPALNKLLVNIKSGVPTVLIDGAPDPYPQFLVKH